MKKVFQRSTRLLAVCCLTLAAGIVQAQETVKIGFLTDMSSMYADGDGNRGAVAIQMAIDDFGGKVLNYPVVLLSADHQNKADIAASKARAWIDTQGLTMLIGGVNSATALAEAKVAEEKKRVFFAVGSGSTALTNEQCTPYTVQYDYDTAMLSKGTGAAVTERGGKSWFFLTADYTFGQSLEEATARTVKEKGGTVLGSVKHPLNASDFSSFMLQAQSSGAQVLGLANAGGDVTNAIKAAREFGLTKTMKIATLYFELTDVHSLGLEAAQGLLLTTTWDWNLDDQTRAFAKRFYTKTNAYPTNIQAADYAATLTYLNAVQAAGTTNADQVMAKLKSMPISAFNVKGIIRPDGRFVRDVVYLMQVKTPSESKGPWDYFKVVATLPGDQVFTTKAESKCALWK